MLQQVIVRHIYLQYFLDQEETTYPEVTEMCQQLTDVTELQDVKELLDVT